MRSFLLHALLALGIAAPLAGCQDLGVGRKCQGDVTPGGTQITKGALECLSHLCYLKGGVGDSDPPVRQVCTAHCTTDADCAGAETGKGAGLCSSSYVCAVANTVGDFACEALCICKDDLQPGLNQAMPPSTNVICPSVCASEGKCPSK